MRYRFYTGIEISRTSRTTRQYRLDGVNGIIFVLILGAEAIEYKVDNIINYVGISQFIVIQTYRFFGQRLQIKVEVFFNDNSQYVKRGTTQRKRVFVVFRMLIDIEDIRQGIYFVSNRQRISYWVGRQVIISKTRLILFIQRYRDIFRFVIVTRIVYFYNVLGVGEFEDYVGYQVVFRQQIRTGSVVNVSVNLFSNLVSQRLDAVSFVAQRF